MASAEVSLNGCSLKEISDKVLLVIFFITNKLAFVLSSRF